MLLVVYLLVTLSFVLSQSLYYQAFVDNTFTTNQGWTIVGASGLFSMCSGKGLLGGYGVFGVGAKVMKLIQLPPHYSMIISMEFWKFDSWDGESFYLYADQTLIYSQSYVFSVPEFSLCGNPGYNDKKETINVQIPHSYQSTFIYMTTSLDSPPNDESWGIRNFKIYLYLCPVGCKTCTSTDLRVTCFPWFLAHQSFIQTIENNYEGWSIENGLMAITTCGCFSLMGGYGKSGTNSIIKNTLKLPSHNKIKIKFRYAYLDSWDSEYAQLYLDGILQWQYPMDLSHARQIQNICGSSGDDIFYNMEIQLFHSQIKSQISFKATLNEAFVSESFGIRDIQIFTSCEFGQSSHFICELCGDGIITESELCDDGNIYPFDGCFGCRFSCVLGCSNCIKGICLECQIGWQYNVQFSTCEQRKDDNLIQMNEICDESLQKVICVNGNFIQPQNCKLSQFGICQYCLNGYILVDNRCEKYCNNLNIVNQIECQDYNLYGLDICNQCQNSLEEGCQEISNGICIQCLVGWYFNEFYNQCIPICGDDKVLGYEQCDIQENDLQIVQYGCQNCNYLCQQQCINCKYGKCYQCQQGWHVNNYKCITICGDNYMKGLEECDDGNEYYNDGCYDCKIECCIECIECKHGKCQQCSSTFTLINNQCIPICGDGLISIEYEQCDDMNQIQYDGCYNCQYQCNQNCQNCINGICIDRCPLGYQLQDNICETICGDQNINGNEQCDDGNIIQYDGCYQCQYQCPQNCQICNNGQCYQCIEGFFLIYNYCDSYCGDGNYASSLEQCDDSNQINGDGCDQNCQIEIDYICQNYKNSYSECTYEKWPRFLAQHVSQIYEEQYVSIKFSQKVKTNNNELFSENIEYYIKGLNQDDYLLQLQIIQEATDEIQEVEYLIIVNINVEPQEPPILEIILHDYLHNIYDAPLLNLVQNVRLKLPKITTQQQKDAATSLQKANTSIIGSLGGLGIVALIFGNSFVFWGLLEVLQQQSYLRFINVVFPENLFIYFEANNIISLQPILDLIHFDEIANIFLQSSYLESYEKFKYYEINADILSNLQTQMVVIIFISLSYFSAHAAYKFLRKFKDFQLQGYNLFAIFNKIRIFLITYILQIRKEGMRQILLANSWDLFFMSFLQLRSTHVTFFKETLTIILALLIMKFLVIIEITQLKRCIKKTFIQYWSKKHNLFVMMKKMSFIAVLVIFQKSQEIQTLLLSFISLVYIIYIQKFKPTNDLFELIKLYIMEYSVLIFTITCFSYWNSLSNYISYQRQLILGWFHIGLLLSVLIINLVLQIYVVLKDVVERVRNNQNNLKKKSSPFPLETVLQQYQM